jgi:hypothetical protein
MHYFGEVRTTTMHARTVTRMMNLSQTQNPLNAARPPADSARRNQIDWCHS